MQVIPTHISPMDLYSKTNPYDRRICKLVIFIQRYQVRDTCGSWSVVHDRYKLKMFNIMYFSYMCPVQRSWYNEFRTQYTGVQPSNYALFYLKRTMRLALMA